MRLQLNRDGSRDCDCMCWRWLGRREKGNYETGNKKQQAHRSCSIDTCTFLAEPVFVNEGKAQGGGQRDTYFHMFSGM